MPGLLTVTTPPAHTRLVDLATVKGDLNVSATTDDAYLTGLIDRASAIIAQYTGRTFGAASYQEVFRFGWEPGIGPAAQTAAPYGTPINVQRKPLILSATPVTNIVSVDENGTVLTAGTDYEADNAAGLIFRLRSGIRSWWNVPTVTVSYTAGYNLPEDPSPTLPADVQEVCAALVRSAYLARGRDPNVAMEWAEGVGRQQYWDRSVTPMALDDSLKLVLNNYLAIGW